MTRTLYSRAALVIRSLLRNALLSDHVVMPEGERGIVASEVVAELEAADEAGLPVPQRDIALQMAEVRAAVAVPGLSLTGGTTREQLSADTGKRVASLAGRYGNFQLDDLERLAGVVLTDDLGQLGGLQGLCADVRSMAASLRRQNER